MSGIICIKEPDIKKAKIQFGHSLKVTMEEEVCLRKLSG